MEYYECVKAHFINNKGVHYSRRKIAPTLGLNRKQVKRAIWMLKGEGLVRQSSPIEVGSVKSNVAVYTCV